MISSHTNDYHCSGYDDIVEVLVRHGANVNAVTKTGASALIIATEMVCTISTWKQIWML